MASPISRPTCLIAAIAVGLLDGAGAFRPLSIAAAQMLTLAHDPKVEPNNNTTNHWLKTLFLTVLPPRSTVIPTPAVSVKRKTAVHDLGGHVLGGHVEEEEMTRAFPSGTVPMLSAPSARRFTTTRVASSAGKKLSMRSSCSPTSSGVPNVVSVENNRRVTFFHL